MSGQHRSDDSSDTACDSLSNSSHYARSRSPPRRRPRSNATAMMSMVESEQWKKGESKRCEEHEEERERYEYPQQQQKYQNREYMQVDSPFHLQRHSRSESIISSTTSNDGSVVSKPRGPYQSYVYCGQNPMQITHSETSSVPSDSMPEWESSHHLHTSHLEPQNKPEIAESTPLNYEGNEVIPPLLLPSGHDTNALQEEEPVVVEMGLGDSVSNITEFKIGDSGVETKTNLMDRMKYETPEDPRNYIINVIINSPIGTVTLQSIREALQWDEQFAAANGTVLDYLQGYQSIFAVSPVDDRVTLRRPLQRAKGRRVIRGSRGYHALSSRIGSISYSYVATAFDIETLAAIYKRRGYETSLTFDVLHVSSHHVFDMFLFPYGVVVWWGLNRRDHWIVEDDFLSADCSFVSEAIKERCSQKSIDELFPFWCSYELDEQYDSSSAATRKDALDKFATHLCFDHYLVPYVAPFRIQIMLTISYLLGRTAVVDFFDSMLQKLQKEVLLIPSDIQGLIDYFSTRRQIARLEGELHLSRVAITTLRDTPEFLWEMPWLDEYYEVTEKHNSTEQLLSWYCAKSDALLQQLENIKIRRFRLFMLGSDVFLILLLVLDVIFIMLRFVLTLYFPLDDAIW